MRIIEEYTDNDQEQLEITIARYIGDFAIRLFFSDNSQKLVDFKPFLEKTLHPSLRKYLDESKFKEYKIVDGNLNWNDYDMIFPLEDLYEGKI
ncbi:MAG: DUF2442 domain-containing protein [Chlorobiales bacterium]|nr:DUF2442 domain-containing protein [Chlorobiales bacterium]